LAETQGEQKWWQKALELGAGVAPLVPAWLVSVGLFSSADAAKRAVSRLLEKRGHQLYKDDSYIADVPFSKLTPYRTPGQRGRDSLALVNRTVPDAAHRLAKLVGQISRLDGEPVDIATLPQPTPGAFEPDLETVDATETPIPASPVMVFPRTIAFGRIDVVDSHRRLSARRWSDRDDDDMEMPIIAASNEHRVYVNGEDVSSLLE
jgi:hypothetical protein